MQVLKRTIESLKPLTIKYSKPVFYFIIDLLWCHIRYGVKRQEYILFNFYKKNRLERSTFYTRGHTKYEPYFNSVKNHDIFWNKAKFNEVFSEFVHRDWLYCKDATKEQIKNFITSHKKVIAKPIDNEQGRGIHIADIQMIDSYTGDGGYILEDFIEQHRLLSNINPSSVNSIRVYTIVDKKGNTDILSASLKVGVSDSIVDNAHSGGYAYPIDIETGIICGRGCRENNPFEMFYFHPESNVKMLGLEIPHWNILKNSVLKAALVIPDSRLIAWDIAVLENEIEFIEGNYTGDRDLMQFPSDTGMLNKIKQYM